MVGERYALLGQEGLGVLLENATVRGLYGVSDRRGTVLFVLGALHGNMGRHGTGEGCLLGCMSE